MDLFQEFLHNLILLLVLLRDGELELFHSPCQAGDSKTAGDYREVK